MERGLLWLPLLGVFIWLAWTGWNEYQTVENYRRWAEQFDQAKYDIYAVLGKKDAEITWGKPTRQGIVNLSCFSLKNVKSIRLLVDDSPVDINNLPDRGNAVLEFELLNQKNLVKIPFTEISLAAKWNEYLQQEWEKLKNN